MLLRTTHTYVELEVSESTYKEIREKLLLADYHHCFEVRDHGTGPIDMHGLALIPEKRKDAEPQKPSSPAAEDL
jgi:hypothetical protein